MDLFPGSMRMAMDEAVNRGRKGERWGTTCRGESENSNYYGLRGRGKRLGGDSRLGRSSFEA